MEYTLNNVIIALDAYSENDNEGSYIRMKFNNKEAILEENEPGKLLIQTKSKKNTVVLMVLTDFILVLSVKDKGNEKSDYHNTFSKLVKYP